VGEDETIDEVNFNFYAYNRKFARVEISPSASNLVSKHFLTHCRKKTQPLKSDCIVSLTVAYFCI